MENNKSNRHAYLIKAHNQFSLLQTILRLLDHPNHDFFIHVDIKAKDFDPEQIRTAVTHSAVYFTEERLDHTWGGSSMVWVDLLLFRVAAEHGPYSYYHLLSGVDMPLHTAQHIYDFFEANGGKEFIHYCSDEFSAEAPQKRRISLYHFLQQKVGRKKNFLALVERASLLAQRLVGIDRTRAYGKKVSVGANWCSVTQAYVEYMLSKEAWLRKHFRWCNLADESYLQVLTDHSPFRDKLYMPDPQGDYHSCMRYIDFPRGPGNGSPYNFRSEDFEDLANSDFMFARKFDLNEDAQICHRLEAHLLALKEKENA